MTHGNQEFRQLYQCEVKRVWHYFRRRGVSEVDTADLVQEVFVRTYAGWEKFVPDNRSAWLFGFVWRVYCEHVRKRVREIVGGDLDDFESRCVEDERYAAVLLELDKLKQSGALTPLAERVLSAKLQGKPEREIAEELGQAAWQVREAYEKVVLELRERLGLSSSETSPGGGNRRDLPKIESLADTDLSPTDLPSWDATRAPADSGCYLKPGLSQTPLLKREPRRQIAGAARTTDDETQGNT